MTRNARDRAVQALAATGRPCKGCDMPVIRADVPVLVGKAHGGKVYQGDGVALDVLTATWRWVLVGRPGEWMTTRVPTFSAHDCPSGTETGTEPQQGARPKLGDTASCESCGAGIIWGTTYKRGATPSSGRPMPLSLATREDRWVRFPGGHPDPTRVRALLRPTFLSHFADCPNASKHRKKRWKESS